MIDNIKVCAVITVYNNIEEVEKITKSLYLQTRPINCCIFIDNSDGKFKTQIKNFIIRSSVNRNIIYVKTKNNIGSAGGFAIGMQIAALCDYDFIWLNDQDGIPSENCLYNLLEAYKKNSDISILAPLILSIENSTELLNFRSKLNIFLNSYKYINTNNCFKIDIAGTTGILIHKDIINKIGVYNNKVCFVGNEDKEYSLRLAKNKINIYCIRNAIYYHPDLSIKHNKKKNIVISNYPIIKLIIPLYLGCVYKDNKVDYYSTLSMSFINYAYGHVVLKYVNILYSVLRLILTRVINSKINLIETLKVYNKGKQLAKKYLYYYYLLNIDDEIKYTEYINSD